MNENLIITVPSRLIIKALESAKASAASDLESKGFTEEEARAIAEKAFKKSEK